MERIHALKDLLRKGDWLAKNRFKRCLLNNFCAFIQSTKVPEVYVQRENLPIQLPILSPRGTYRSPKNQH